MQKTRHMEDNIVGMVRWVGSLFQGAYRVTGKAKSYDSDNNFIKIQQIQQEVMNYQSFFQKFEEENTLDYF